VKALIVDDEPTVRLLLSRILRREVDCVVTEATNGLEALELLARQRFDFVVIDVMMPIMDGLEMLEAIRGTPQLQHLPVMVLSAVRDEAQVRRLVSLGISAYLTKPLRPSDASARVQRFVASLGVGQPGQQAFSGRSFEGLAAGGRLLVVDGDEDFRHFLRNVIGSQYTLVEAEGGAQGLRSCLEARPAAILLGQNLGAVGAPMFLRKVRSLPGLASVPVIVAGSREAAALVPDADAVVARTFVPEAFKAQFARLRAGTASAPGTAPARPELRPHMISATEQVFGMMLGVEVTADAAEPNPPATGTDLATVLLTMPGGVDLEFGLVADRAHSEQMTALLLQGSDVVSDDDVSSTLQEIANIISGRLQSWLKSRGEQAVMGLPKVVSLDEALDVGEGWTPVGFHDAAGEMRFATFLRPVARIVDVTAAPSVETAIV
jgi:two-component system chemotaxis response regulator CheY